MQTVWNRIEKAALKFVSASSLLLQVVSSAIVDKYIGESARMIREMFQYARDHQPCIIFMDEIDAIGGRRFSEGTSADREIQRTLMEVSRQVPPDYCKRRVFRTTGIRCNYLLIIVWNPRDLWPKWRSYSLTQNGRLCLSRHFVTRSFSKPAPIVLCIYGLNAELVRTEANIACLAVIPSRSALIEHGLSCLVFLVLWSVLDLFEDDFIDRNEANVQWFTRAVY